MKKLLSSIRSRASTIFHWLKNHLCFNPQQYWDTRADTFGRHSVYNMAHSREELNQLDIELKNRYRSILKKYISEKDADVLDFGCGWGRFSDFLLQIFPGKIIGVDISKKSIEQNSIHDPRCIFKTMESEKIPLQDQSVDVVFIHLVLGALSTRQLKVTLAEIDRVSKSNALFFVVENTDPAKDLYYWHFHTKQEYIQMLSFAQLEHVVSYLDINEEISIFCGRKR